MTKKWITFVIIVVSYFKVTFGNEETNFDDENTNNIVGFYGETSRLNCIVNNLNSNTVSWVRDRDNYVISLDTHVVSRDTRFEIIQNKTEGKDNFILNINLSKFEDVGNYRCIIFSELKLNYSVALSLKEDTSLIKFCENIGVLCKNGFTCVNITNFCDNETNCDDGWDEQFCEEGGYSSRSCHIWGCEDVCIPPSNEFYHDFFLRLIPKCFCNKIGFELDADGKSCKDINECLEENGDCNHLCINTEGSYHCSCMEGYTFSRNGQKCEKNNQEAAIFFSTAQSINIFEVHYRRINIICTIIPYAVGIAFNSDYSHIVWLRKDYHNKRGQIRYFDSPWSYRHRSSIKCPEDVKIDRLTSLIYVADVCTSEIIVFELLGAGLSKYFVQVSTITNPFILKPAALALDSQNRVLYWADWGTNLGIQRAKMNGSDEVVLIKDSILKPKALVWDETTKRLFWTDFELGVIESINTDGKERKTILRSNAGYKPYALVVFEDRIFFSNWTSRSVMACEKNQCDEDNIEELFTANDVITDLEV